MLTSTGRPTRGKLIPALTALVVMTLAIPAPAMAIDNQGPIGTHDGFAEAVADAADECYANGWAVDPDDPNARLSVRISLDGVVVATVTADQFRDDLAEAGISDGYSSFWYDLRGDMTLGQAASVLVEAQDAQTAAWHPIDSTPRVLTCVSAPPIGFHDIAEGTVPAYECVAAGWSVDVDSATTRVSVRVLVDGRVVTSGPADMFREDLVEAGVPGDGFSGYGFDLWPLIQPLAWHEVRTQAQDNETGAWSDLEATPRQLRCTNTPASPFVGSWTAPDDADGSTQSLAIGGGVADFVLTYRDSFATICQDAGSATTRFQATGSGRLVAPDLIEVTLTRQHCGSTTFDPFGPIYFSYDAASDQLFSDLGTWSRR